MKNIMLFFILGLVSPVILYSKSSNEYWSEIIKKNVPKELQNIKVIERKDVKVYGNLYAFDKFNPDFIIKDDLNNNGKEDAVVPCVSQKNPFKWYILIFEKTNSKYVFITYFEFNLQGMYVFKVVSKWGKKIIRVGESLESDVSTYIWWENGKYVHD